MTDQRDLDHLLDAWFHTGPAAGPDRIITVVADRIERQAQRPGWRFWRVQRPELNEALVFVALVALLALAVAAAAVIGQSPTLVPPRVAPAILPITSASHFTPLQTPTAVPPFAFGPGRIVVEVADTNLDNQLRYIAADRRALPLLPDFGGHQRTAAWRPDGQRLAFAGRPRGQADEWMHLYETLPDGTSLGLVTTDCEPPTCIEETDPAYSPDGNRMVAVRLADLRGGRPTRSVLVVYNITRGRAAEIPGTSFPYDIYDIGHPRWSPDGRQITFHVVQGPPTSRRRLIFPESTPPGPSSIYVIGTDGSGRRQLTPDGLDAGDPDWSHDGSWIVFGPTPLHLWLYGLDQTDWQIRAIRPDGTDLHTVVPGGDVATPSWTADGTRIVFTEISGAKSVIRSVRPDGSDLQDVLTFQSRDILMYPIQQPTP